LIERSLKAKHGMDSKGDGVMPNEHDIQLLSRYLDGELPAPESRELESRLHSDGSLQSTLLRMQELDHRLRDALAERESVPESIMALLTASQADEAGSDNVLRFPVAGAERRADTAQAPRWGFALAASFVAAIALVLVSNLDQTPQSSLPGNDSLVSRALDEQGSGSDWYALGDGRELQPVLTFAHEDGRWCREYLLRGGESDWRAVACRSATQWETQAAGLESYLETSGAYRPAGAADSAPVAVFINQNAADIALGRDDEVALIANNWARQR
jgi:anti-sigma factor RsiW